MRTPLLNEQPAEKLDRREDGSLDVVNVWFTIQGEGPHSGLPAIFIRLAGCNLVCPQCDTDYTSTRDINDVDFLMSKVKSLTPQDHDTMVVITGGEPFRQNLTPFVRELLDARVGGYFVQIETNGTLFLPGFPYDHENVECVCSPKTPKINPDFVEAARPTFKYVLDADHICPVDGLPTRVLGLDLAPARPVFVEGPSTRRGKNGPIILSLDEIEWRGDIFVQPADAGMDISRSIRNMRACIDSSRRHGYRISLQLHKILGLE